MINRAWKETEFDSELYYDQADGLIVGMVHKLGTQSVIWLAKVYAPGTYEEGKLGNYVSRDHARRAVERYWDIQERTLIE